MKYLLSIILVFLFIGCTKTDGLTEVTGTNNKNINELLIEKLKANNIEFKTDKNSNIYYNENNKKIVENLLQEALNESLIDQNYSGFTFSRPLSNQFYTYLQNHNAPLESVEVVNEYEIRWNSDKNEIFMTYVEKFAVENHAL